MTADAPPRPESAPPPVVRRRADRGRIYLALAVIAVAAIVLGVGAGTSWYGLRPAASTTGCPTGVTIQGAGANFPAAIVSQWVTNYHTADGNLVNYDASGAGQGITLLTDKSVDFAITDEGLTTSEASALTGAVGTFLTMPVTGGAVVLVYNIPGYSGSLNLTGQDVAGIYLGSITTWNNSALVANNPALASITATIVPVHRADTAGMTYVLTNLLSDDNTTWNTTTGLGTSIGPSWPNVTGSVGATGNSEMLTDVKSDAGAIGYTDLYDAEAKALPIATVENPKGQFVTPTVADTAAAISYDYAAFGAGLPPITGDWSTVSWVNAQGSGDYPLATLVYLLVPQDPGHGHTASATDAAALRQWIDYVATAGQSYNTTQFPFVSPPSPLLSEDVAALAAMTYNGASFASCP